MWSYVMLFFIQVIGSLILSAGQKEVFFYFQVLSVLLWIYPAQYRELIMRDTHPATAHRCLEAADVSRDRGRRAGSLLCVGLLAAMSLCGCGKPEARLVLTKPLVQDAVFTRQYVGQIKSGRRTELRAESPGYLEVMNVQEGQSVEKGVPMFKILPQPAGAVAQRTATEPQPEVTVIAAPFDGRMSLLRKKNGSPVLKDELITTLADNHEMVVDFDVPEAQFQGYATSTPAGGSRPARLILANGRMFDQTGQVKMEKTEVNARTGTVPLHAVFPNPNDLLRQGESGNVQLQDTLKHAVLVPQKATFQLSDQTYAFVVGQDGVIRQRRLAITNELRDFFVVTSGVGAEDRIVFEGTSEVHDGDKAGNAVFEEPAKAYAGMKVPTE